MEMIRRRDGRVKPPIVHPPKTTIIQVPPWRFKRFSEFPDEIQLMIWKAALEPAINHQPRLIAAHTMVPPITETHKMVRILAQTCVKSREVALPVLKACMEHENRHYLAIPSAPAERRATPAAQAALTAQAQAQAQAIAQIAQAAAAFIPPNGTPAINPALFFAFNPPAPAPPPVEPSAPTPFRQLTAKQRRTYKFAGAGEDLVKMHYLLNGVHNHIHVDDDYFLFVDQTVNLLLYDTTRFASIISKIQKVIVPASILFNLFKPRQHFLDAPPPDWLPSVCKEAVIILPVCADIRDFDNVYRERVHEEGSISIINNDSARWSEASEIPYTLLHFWTDEEMALFEDSFKSRWCYHVEQEAASQSDIVTISMPSYENAATRIPHHNLSTEGPLGARAAKYKEHISSRPPQQNPFDRLKDTHLFLGLWHIWSRIRQMQQTVPQLRFAHVKGLRAYNFLAEAQGETPEVVIQDWQQYIPRYSCREIHSILKNERWVHLDTKRRSEIYPRSVKEQEQVRQFTLERLNRDFPTGMLKVQGAMVPQNCDGPDWCGLKDEEHEFRLDRCHQYAWQACMFKSQGPNFSLEEDPRQDQMWRMCGNAGDDEILGPIASLAEVDDDTESV
ncbi:hypothetical protein QBC43DRAFT_325376 [Cladorrhinum sp. PSN259]|nr:hypothetical protein QBC43DRAFT_325376 [Cladorrhinum sp. PSN259]